MHRCIPRRAAASVRRVHANDARANALQHFAGNAVTNTKYTLLSFLPRNLLEQFGCVTVCVAALD
jgi:hypothetical protein